MTEGKIKLLIADDHAILRQGLRRILEAEPDMAVIGEAATGIDAVKRARQLKPDVVIMDISMPGLNGLEATTRASRQFPKTRIIMLSAHSTEEYVGQALRAAMAISAAG